MGKRVTKFEVAGELAELAKMRGDDEAYDLALRAKWDFDYSMNADARGERSRAWAKRSSGNRLLQKARERLGIFRRPEA